MATVRHLKIVEGSCGTTHKCPFLLAIPCKSFVMTDIVVLKLCLNFLSFTLGSSMYWPKITSFWEFGSHNLGEHRSHP